MKKRFVALNDKVRGVKKGEEFTARYAIGRALVAIGAAKPLDDEYETRNMPAVATKKAQPPKTEPVKAPDPVVNATDGAIAEANKHNIDLSIVQGTGENGRIIKNDITALLDDENTGL